MGSSTFGTRVSRFFRKRGVRERLAQVADPRDRRGRQGALSRVLETVLGALLLPIRSGHQVDEQTRTGPRLQGGELRLAPLPDAPLPGILPQRDPTEGRQVLVDSVRAEVRRKSVTTPAGASRTLALDGKGLWRGRRGGCAACQGQGGRRVPRVVRALLTSARPRICLEQRTLAADEHEMGAFTAFGAPLCQRYGRLHLCEVVTLAAGDGSRHNARRLEGAGDGDVLALKDNQPELWREAQRILVPRAASQRPAAKVLARDHGPWVRRSFWRTHACATWLDWTHRRQVWLVRTEPFTRPSTPRAASLPVAVEDHDSRTHLPWQRREGMSILGVVRSHWGIDNNGFRTLDMEGHEERAWCTKGAATEVLGLLRLWADN